MKKLIHWIINDIEPEQNELFLCSPDVKYFYRNKTHLSYQNGLLYYHWKDQLGGKLLLIIPECLKEEVMSLNHDISLTGHMSIAKTIAHIKNRSAWYKLTDEVEQFVKSCSACNQNKKATVKPKAPLGQYHTGTIAIARRQPVPPNERKRRPGFHPRQDRHTTIHSPGGLVPASLARGT